MTVSFKDLPLLRKKHRNQKIIFAGGCFDLLHIVHLAFLETLKSMGNVVVVVVSRDERVKERKGALRPVIPQAQRLKMIDAFKCVDYAFIAPKAAGKMLPTVRILNALKPDIFAVVDKNWLKFKDIQETGIKLQVVKIRKLNSTSRIIAKIQGSTERSHSLA